MSAAHLSITGYTIVPASDRVAGPTRPRVRRSLIARTIASIRLRHRERQAWNAGLAAERAAAPAFHHPRDGFTLRHPGSEIQRL